MARGIVALYAFENEYVERLMEYLEQKNGLPFKLIAFTQKEEMARFLEEEVIHILLAEQDDINDINKDVNLKKIVLLSEGTTKKEYREIDTIYKYQSTENIMRELLEYYMEVTAEEEIYVDRKEAELIAVYSPNEDENKTLLALLIGQVLSKNRKTLYVSLEEFSALDSLMGVEFEGNISDLMYYFRQNMNMVGIKLQALVRSINQMDVLPPTTYSLDLRNIDISWWVKLIERIVSAGIYDVVIVDVGSIVGDAFKILEQCDKVYMPYGEGIIAEKKVETFEKFLLRSDRESLYKKIKKIETKGIHIEKWDESYLDELVWGKAGDFVRNLLQEEKRDGD